MKMLRDYLKSYHKFSIDCNMSAEKAAYLLESEIYKDDLSGFNGEREELHFRLTYIRDFGRSSFRPDITVDILYKGDDRCCINVTMDLFFPIKLLIAIWEVPLILFSLFFIIVATTGKITLFLFICPLFAVAGYLFTIIAFNSDAVPAKNRMYELFNIKESVKVQQT